VKEVTTMTTKHQDEDKGGEDKGWVDRRDLKAEEKPTEKQKTVKLKSPQGTTVETDADKADTLKDAGYT
jgi:hypothetical protein